MGSFGPEVNILETKRCAMKGKQNYGLEALTAYYLAQLHFNPTAT